MSEQNNRWTAKDALEQAHHALWMEVQRLHGRNSAENTRKRQVVREARWHVQVAYNALTGLTPPDSFSSPVKGRHGSKYTSEASPTQERHGN